jgi:hypothetical protein
MPARAARPVTDEIGTALVPREILHLSMVTVSIALSRLPARVADALAAPLLRLAIGDLSKLGFRPAATGPITQIKTSSRVPLIDIGTIGLVRAGQIGIRGGVRSMDEGHPRSLPSFVPIPFWRSAATPPTRGTRLSGVARGAT